MNRSSLIAGLIALMAAPSFARLSAEKRVDEMASTADVIIKGEVEKVESLGKADLKSLQDDRLTAAIGPYSPKVSVADVRVDRAIKGKPGAVAKVRFFSSDTEAFASLAKGEYVVLFLKRRRGDLYLLDADNGKLSASRKVEASKEAAGGPSDPLTEEMRAMASDSDGVKAVAGIRGLRQLKHSGSLPMLKSLSRDTRPKVRAAAIGARLGLGDDSAGDELAERLAALNSSAPQGAEDPQEYLGAIDSLARGKHPKKVRLISDLAEHKNQFVRRQALQELREMRAPESVPTLAKLLDSPEWRTQYTGVITLCEIARSNKRGCPSAVRFEKDKEKLVAEWKAWAAAHPDGKP